MTTAPVTTTTLPPATLGYSVTAAGLSVTPSDVLAVQPEYVPAGLPGARVELWGYVAAPATGDYSQTYVGDGSRSSVPELWVTSDTSAGSLREAASPETLGGKAVTIQRSVRTGVTEVVVVLDGQPTALIGAYLTDGDFAQVLSGIRRRTGRPGWDLTVLPRGLRLRTEGYSDGGGGYVLRFTTAADAETDPDVYVEVESAAPGGWNTCECNPDWDRWLQRGDVSGHVALVAELEPAGEATPVYEFRWQYGPGVFILLVTAGYPLGTALRVASSVRPATLQSWARLTCTVYRGTAETQPCPPLPEG